MASESEVKARAQELQNELNIVIKNTDQIAKCASDMYNKIAEEIHPSYVTLQTYWCGSAANSYFEKTSITLNEAATDCRNIKQAAVDILGQYLEYVRQEIIRLGGKPNEVLPSIFKE